MSVLREIPLIAQNQTLTIALGGKTYNLSMNWNAADSVWILDVADSSGIPLVRGIPLVTGVDLLAPFVYLSFGGQLVASTDHNADAPPTFANLGSAGHLYWVTPT